MTSRPSEPVYRGETTPPTNTILTEHNDTLASSSNSSIVSTQLQVPTSPRPVVPMPAREQRKSAGEQKKRKLPSPNDPTSVKRVTFGSPSMPEVVISRRPRVRASTSRARLRRRRRRYVAEPIGTPVSPIITASLPSKPLAIEEMDTSEAHLPSPILSPTCLFDWRITLQDDSFNFRNHYKSMDVD